jgi:hypothetical protein
MRPAADNAVSAGLVDKTLTLWMNSTIAADGSPTTITTGGTIQWGCVSNAAQKYVPKACVGTGT